MRPTSDEYQTKILIDTYYNPSTVRDISKRCAIPIASCYKEVRKLENAGLLKNVGCPLNKRGQRANLFEINPKELEKIDKLLDSVVPHFKEKAYLMNDDVHTKYLSSVPDSEFLQYSGKSPGYVLRKLLFRGIQTSFEEVYERLKNIDGFAIPRRKVEKPADKKPVYVEQLIKEFDDDEEYRFRPGSRTKKTKILKEDTIPTLEPTEPRRKGPPPIVPKSVYEEYNNKGFTASKVYEDLVEKGFDVSEATVRKHIRELGIKVVDGRGLRKQFTRRSYKTKVKEGHMPPLTVDDLAIAIRGSIDKHMEMKNAKAMARHVLNFFGYSTRITDNLLEPEDRDLFYMLEDSELLTTQREETTLYDGREWRIHYWILGKKRIIELVENNMKKKDKTKKAADEFSYEDLPEWIWGERDDEYFEQAEALPSNF